MSQLRFAQLSDTHIRKDYSTGILQEMFASLISPEQKLREILSELKKESLDFIAISGDLVHEGNEADYQQLKTILEESDFQVPVLLALGNHDNKEAFCDVFRQELQHGRYYYCYQIREWKIVVLDSANRENGLGGVDDAQIKWFEEIYEEESSIIVFLHHPLFWDDLLLQLGENRERLIHILARSNVKAVFCGHVHRNGMREQEKIRQFTAESTACGFDYTPNGILEQERSGYLYGSISECNMEIEHCFWGNTEVYQMSNHTLKSVLDKKE